MEDSYVLVRYPRSACRTVWGGYMEIKPALKLFYFAVISVVYVAMYDYLLLSEGVTVGTGATRYVLGNILILMAMYAVFVSAIETGTLYIFFVSLVVLLLILLAENAQFGTLSLGEVLKYIYLVCTYYIVSTLVFIVGGDVRKIYKIVFVFLLTLLLIAFPLIYIGNKIQFGCVMSNTEFYSLWQSNFREAYSFVSDYVSLLYVSLVAFIVALIFVMIVAQARCVSGLRDRCCSYCSWVKNISGNIYCIILLLLIFSIFVKFGVVSYDMYSYPITSYIDYKYNIDVYKKLRKQRDDNQVKLASSKHTTGETYVVVIGESLNKKHMGIYGYFRDTTPLLSKEYKSGDILKFTNTYANHTHTIPVLTLSLTRSNQYNEKAYYRSVSILELAKKAGFEIYWITNQCTYGPWDNPVSVLADSADKLVSINGFTGKSTLTQYYDDELIDYFSDALKTETKKNKLIFIHLMGNHGSYSSRFPKSFKRFSGDLDQGYFGKNTSFKKDVNDYDNSVLFNDYVVAAILKILKKNKGTDAFLYMADHADDVLARKGHNSEIFSFEMTQIPFLGWFSDKYRSRYPDIYHNLSLHQGALFSNDLLYDTLVGVLGITTERYNEKYDLSSAEYSLAPDEALTLHGRMKYSDKSNSIYWQERNSRYLLDTHQDQRLFPHRVNSIGKLKDIFNNGLRSFEIDVLFTGGDRNTFILGHGEEVKGVDIRTFLDSVNYREIKRVWIDIKNLNSSNFEAALVELELLDKKYDLKEKVILESSVKFDLFRYFREKGWYTAYNISIQTHSIDFDDPADETEMEKLFSLLSRQVAEQEVAAVSFNGNLYTYVKKYLEPKIPENIDYHIWYGPRLYEPDFEKKLAEDDLYLDKRVKTLLCPYKSQYEL